MNVYDFEAGEQARRCRVLAAHIADPEHGPYAPISSPSVADVAELPADVALGVHPRPWRFDEAGNGKGWVVDSEGRQIVSLCLWNASDRDGLRVLLDRVNACDEEWDKVPAHRASNLALVVAAFGVGHALVVDADDAITEFLACSDPSELFGEAVTTDGVWICSLGLVDDGPGDWPGSRECRLEILPQRLATADEWDAVRRDEWPWSEGSAS